MQAGCDIWKNRRGWERSLLGLCRRRQGSGRISCCRARSAPTRTCRWTRTGSRCRTFTGVARNAIGVARTAGSRGFVHVVAVAFLRHCAEQQRFADQEIERIEDRKRTEFRPDKKALASELKAGREIPGADLHVGEYPLVVS